jgi:hypothetical protein
MSATNGTTANRAALEAAVCPVCGAGLAMPAHMAPTLSCLSPSAATPSRWPRPASWPPAGPWP